MAITYEKNELKCNDIVIIFVLAGCFTDVLSLLNN